LQYLSVSNIYKRVLVSHYLCRLKEFSLLFFLKSRVNDSLKWQLNLSSLSMTFDRGGYFEIVEVPIKVFKKRQINVKLCIHKLACKRLCSAWKLILWNIQIEEIMTTVLLHSFLQSFPASARQAFSSLQSWGAKGLPKGLPPKSGSGLFSKFWILWHFCEKRRMLWKIETHANSF